MAIAKISLYCILKNTFFNYKINMQIKTTTTAIKNQLKRSPMSEYNTYLAEPNLEVLLLR